MPKLRKLAKALALLLVGLVTASLTGFVPGFWVAIYNAVFGTTLESADALSAHLLSKTQEIYSQLTLADAEAALWIVAGAVVLVAMYTHGWPFLFRSLKRRTLLRRVGLRAYLPRATEGEREAGWEDCKSHLQDGHNDSIYLVCANGWETFGADGAPLHGVLDKFPKFIRVLLIYPYSEAIEMRANDVQMDVDVYRTQLQGTLEYCKGLKKKGRNIEVRLFDWPPVWKMIISHSRLWLQHYEHGKHVDETPAYSFDRFPAVSSLYHPFQAEFTRMWSRSEEVDLSKDIAEIMMGMKGRPRPVACKDCDGRPAGVPKQPEPTPL